MNTKQYYLDTFKVTEEDLQKVENHIREIGFEKMKNNDAFIYAPC